jgi:ATP-dependent Clp protease protease subunit
MANLSSPVLPPEQTRTWDKEVPIIVDEPRKTITAFITGSIEEPKQYNELCYSLNIADEYMTVYLNINTPGGIIDSALMVVDAINKSKAKVVGTLTGTVASAGTIIAMACDELIIAPHLSFMIHNYSGGMSGKGHEMKARQKFTDEHLNDAFTYFYKGFLSEIEMTNVIDGTDLWMGTNEVISRWQDRVDYIQSKK